ncbi:hypothetical protein NDA11_004337 [Ustilago hordei]|uniref:FHA domain-containing protein n=1 Tax=Ustilago hordei TaxID=120017 RepID=I2G2J8_USTHO|nr:uncharacterized protein UHO2_02737 [Ustilago hordei]KAJ1040422.1 hypothetical protein NDA10_001350 [Ustilago hordei]KAJ1585495.1 hypothetical protein NDA15_006819 [Ustilago hordei]KAJ1587972.1 hypothetical protein NDA12_002536 [Ustilago hordei]KAJ1593033.1 hypothetical protein NDA11_004337 [Ustilago hordei]KAJ1601449.1 hypothetical protein NDA14_002721 [Ustilago hordei]
MMHDLPTPAPSSDPLMPGSSPVKGAKDDKTLFAGKTAAVSRPFAPLDLNVVGNRVKSFQDAREKAGATPPPSSPPASSVFQSSPIAPCQQQQALGFSPVKQQRTSPASNTSIRSIVLEQNDTPLSSIDRQHRSISQPLGLVANPDGGHVPNLLFGSKSVSLVIGRSKPSGQPHSSCDHNEYSATATADIPASMHGLGASKILRVNLANDARHVSRVHAIVEWIPFVARPAASKKQGVSSFTAKGSPIAARIASQNGVNGTFIVRIVGQNGLIVDGKRRREGQVLRLTSGKSLIDFFGVKCRFEHVPSSTDLPPSPVKSTQARVQDWTQRVTSPVKRATPKSVDRSEITQEVAASSPPVSSPLSMPSLMSPSKRGVASQRRMTSEAEEEDRVTSSPTPVNRWSGGLVAGPLNIQQVRAGDSDQEMGGKGSGAMDDDEEDQDDESDDEDYVPVDFDTARKSVLVTRKPVATQTATEGDYDDNDSSSLSDLDSGLVDQQIGDSALATQPIASPVPAQRKRTVLAGSTPRSRESSAKPALADALTESQTRMPPPAAAIANVRSAARRSASNSPAPSSPLPGSSVQELQSLARNCIRQLAPTYDLPGLLAGAVVFHRTATISASEAVRSVLSTTPGLMKGEAGEHSVAFSPSKRKLPGSTTLQHGCIVEGWPTTPETNERWTSIARKAWREHLEVVLQSSPMFGVIQRAGKDASGNPLECWYYYDKENDPDKERAENLGVFAKPMRKALKGQKPIFWKQSGYASRQTDEVVETKSYTQTVQAAASSKGRMDQESMDIATASIPSSCVGNGRKRKAQAHEETQTGVKDETSAETLDEERRREKLRAKIAKSGLWDETQPEEKEEPTWDRKGDQDYRKGRK